MIRLFTNQYYLAFCLCVLSHFISKSCDGFSNLPHRPSAQCQYFDQKNIKNEFPTLKELGANGKPLIYLDNAATSQKPNTVINTVKSFYSTSNGNVHRSGHLLSRRATECYEQSRNIISKFIGSATPNEVVFTKGATESINLVASTWGVENLRVGDEVIISVAEHHSNIVPWQLLAQRNRFSIKYVWLDGHGRFDMNHFKTLLSVKTKLICLSHVSNVLGYINPIEEVCSHAQKVGARVLVDACQSLPHIKVDVGKIGCDWLVGSSHKMCGPTGVGFLWGKYDLLSMAPPYQGGGEMVDEVFLSHSTYAPPPLRFESGTPPIAQAVGFGEACRFLENTGMDNIAKHASDLGVVLWEKLSQSCLDLELYGPSPAACAQAPWGSPTQRLPILTFNHKSAHASDLAFLVDQQGIALRSGHHCAQPLHKYLGISSSLRASLCIYNDESDVDALVRAIRTATNTLI